MTSNTSGTGSTIGTGNTSLSDRFGLAGITFQRSPPTEPSVLNEETALVELSTGLDVLCTSLCLPNAGLGTLWRERDPSSNVPQIKVVLWDTHRFGEEGNYAPVCGTVNLFGTLSSLFHEFGHAIDFGLDPNGPPWSHRETWQKALAQDAPDFCARLMPANRGGRMRLSDVYLAAPHEIFARVFECFILERATTTWRHAPECTDAQLYPQDEERDRLCAHLEHHVSSKLQDGWTNRTV